MGKDRLNRLLKNLANENGLLGFIAIWPVFPLGVALAGWTQVYEELHYFQPIWLTARWQTSIATPASPGILMFI